MRITRFSKFSKAVGKIYCKWVKKRGRNTLMERGAQTRDVKIYCILYYSLGDDD